MAPGVVSHSAAQRPPAQYIRSPSAKQVSPPITPTPSQTSIDPTVNVRPAEPVSNNDRPLDLNSNDSSSLTECGGVDCSVNDSSGHANILTVYTNKVKGDNVNGNARSSNLDDASSAARDSYDNGGVAAPRKPSFHAENERLRSFGAWPSTAPISKEKVARAGFYYLGNALDTACPFCKLEVSDWACDDIALRKHRERSPECPFVLRQSAASAAASLPLEELMKRPEKRLETFSRWPKPDVMDPQRLVNAGFYYLNEGDRVRCAWCKGVIEQWERDDVPFDEHARNFSCCPFVLNPPEYACRGDDEVGYSNMCPSNRCCSLSAGSTPACLRGVIPHAGPKHPNMVSSTSRLATFTSQKWSANVQPEQLVDAGFFFLGMHDYTKCFHCDGGLCNWERGDDPWIEHARWFPNCKFVQLNKGEAFVRDCQLRHEEMLNAVGAAAAAQESAEALAAENAAASNSRASDDQLVATSAAANALPDHLQVELDAIMTTDDVKFYLGNGVPPQVIRMTLKKFMLDKQRGFSSHKELAVVLAQVLNFGDKQPDISSGTTSQTKAEDIPENVLCRVCMARERGIVFLPCGHLATCSSCAASVTECVMCRAPIAGTLRTFLS